MINSNNYAYFPDRHIDIEIVNCPCCESKNYKEITKSFDYDYFTTNIIFTIVNCLDCGLTYINPRPKITEVEKIYPPEYSAYHFDKIENTIIKKARNFMQSGKAKRIFKCIKDNEQEIRIIDIGCGSPAFLKLIENFSNRRKIDLYGNDVSSEILLSVENAGFKTVPGTFENVEWEENFFDVVVMNQVIEHLFDVKGNLNKVFRLLKSGGVLFIETPSDEGLDAKLFRKKYWGGYHVPRHLQIFNALTIDRMLKSYGFVVEQIECLPSPNFWTSSIRNFLFTKGIPRYLTRRMNYSNLFFMTLFTLLDTVIIPFHCTSNMRVIARKP